MLNFIIGVLSFKTEQVNDNTYLRSLVVSFQLVNDDQKSISTIYKVSLFTVDLT